MSNAFYPFPSVTQAPGLTWNVKRTPNFQTIIHKAVSGREQRARFQQFPIDDWEMAYSRLLEKTEFATIIGFYKQRGGSFDDFLFTMPSDNIVALQLLGTGDGVTVDFPLIRAMGGLAEFVENGVMTAVQIAGTPLVPSGYSVTSVGDGFNNNLHLVAAPTAGQSVAASFTYSWRVRFKDDMLEFDNFLYRLWNAASVKFTQVLL